MSQLPTCKITVLKGQADSNKPGEAVYLLETWIESVIDFDRLPGMSLAVVHDQEIVYAKGFGYADIERQARATPGTIYNICSISKLFTSVAVMQLCDLGKLSLDDSVSKHLPWFTPELAGSTQDPVGSLARLRNVEGNVFRQVRDDGELGKHYVFEADSADNVIGMKFNNNLLKKTVR